MPGRGSPPTSLLVSLREAAGLTQEEAARRAGMSVRGLSNLERGLVSRPRRASLDALAQALRLSDRDHRRLLDQYRPVETVTASWRGPRSALRDLVGRDAALAELRLLLRERDLVTVTGPGGSGKTALALAAATGHPHPVTVLGLTSLAAPEQLVPALATVLDVRGVTLDAVEHVLAPGRQLLVIDNAEHLAGAVAELVLRLRGACPELTVLVTSRQPLGLSEELVWRLLPLRVPAGDADERAPAAELFRRRIREALPSADLTDAAAIGRICRRLDGLPLALELAAARVRALAVPELADRLESGTDLLTSAVPGPGGRRTLEDTIDWSYRLLARDEQRALAQLSVFRGTFGPAAVEAVVAVPGSPVALAAQLVDRSLLQAEPGGGRWSMLRTIRDYAGQRLADSGELAATRCRHFELWLDRGRRLDAIAGFGERLTAARALVGDLADAEHALAGGLAADRGDEVVQLAALLHDCWNVAPGYAGSGVRWLAVVDGVAERCPPRLRARARTARGQLLSVLGDRAGGIVQLRAALPDAGALPAAGRLDVMSTLALAELDLLEPAAARAWQLLVAAEGTSGDQLAASLSVVVDIELQYGRPERAEPVSERLGALVRTTSGWLAGGHHCQRAQLAARRGDAATARTALREALATADGLGTARRFRLRFAVAEVLLAIDEPAEAYEYATAELAPHPPELVRWAPVLQVPRAEAMRRLGRSGAAAAVRTGLEAARADQKLAIVLSGVLVAAAVARGTDDTAAADLGAGWQQVRRVLGLPVPAAYRQAARDLGLDLAAPDPEQGRAAGAELDALVGRALSVLCRMA